MANKWLLAAVKTLNSTNAIANISSDANYPFVNNKASVLQGDIASMKFRRKLPIR